MAKASLKYKELVLEYIDGIINQTISGGYQRLDLYFREYMRALCQQKYKDIDTLSGGWSTKLKAKDKQISDVWLIIELIVKFEQTNCLNEFNQPDLLDLEVSVLQEFYDWYSKSQERYTASQSNQETND